MRMECGEAGEECGEGERGAGLQGAESGSGLEGGDGGSDLTMGEQARGANRRRGEGGRR